MCLTNDGNLGPEEDLCGFHGVCLDNKCVCESGWSNSFEAIPSLFINEGARELYNNITDFSEEPLSLTEFNRELLSRSPCSRHDNAMYGLQGSAFLLCLFAIIFHLPYATSRKSRFKRMFPQLFTFSTTLFGALIKFDSLDNVYPFHFAGSLSTVLFTLLFNLSTNIFFLKYTGYHLKKARLNFGLQVTIFGYNGESLFIFQTKYLYLFDIIIYTGSWAFPVFAVLALRNQSDFNFDLLVFAQKIFLVQNFYSLFRLSYLNILTYSAFTGLSRDFIKMSNFQKSADGSPSINSNYSLLLNLSKLMTQIRNSVIIFNTSWFIYYFLYGFFPRTQLSFQYFSVIAGGFMWPILSLVVLRNVKKQKKTDISKNKNTVDKQSKQKTQKFVSFIKYVTFNPKVFYRRISILQHTTKITCC
eukprot:maker-scaffold_2-snap-gene-7.23-mRNA-1 protein AED:0.08 eAED:0.08 QI:183/0.33/0.25/0.5/1/1/4/0/414